jgi:hypothetical protein
MFIVYIFLYLIRTLVLHRTFHYERGVFCQFILHIFKVLLMKRAVFLWFSYRLPFFPIHSKHWYNLVGIEVDQYRESIGKYYTVARSVNKGKLLSITDIACFNLLLLYGTKITPLLILVHFFCKAVLKYTSYWWKLITAFFVLKCLNFFIVLCILLIISGNRN